MSVTVIDNFLDKDEFNLLSSIMTNTPEFPWYFNNGVVSPIENNGKDFLENYQFTHLFYDNHKPNSEYFVYLANLIKKINPTAIVRIKANLNPVTSKEIVYPFHVDFPGIKCKTAIFYMNTCNGYSIIGDQKIESVANRFVIFDSEQMHTGTTCTDQKYRCLINFNYFN
jgi:hypothetical protein